MAREIQSQSNRAQGGKAVVAQLGNAVFWVVVALAVPVEEFLRPIPEIAPYAHLAPILLYVLAAWSFLRAIRTLQRVAASRMWNPRIQVSGASGASGASRPVGNRRAKTGPAAVVTRPPTVQRMR
jgi:hypothetical protein